MRRFDRLRTALPGPDVSLGYTLVQAPWGGSNQFLTALVGELGTRGYAVREHTVGRRTRVCLLNGLTFDPERIRRARRAGCRIVHRVDGPVDVYRGRDDGVDRETSALNAEFADVTVFQSRYSLEAHESLDLTFHNPIVVHNAVDPRTFFPPAAEARAADGRIRLIATSWSDNPNKGGDTYRWLDEHLDRSRYEFTFVGRCPVELPHARVIAPVGSAALAELLREHHVVVTASRFEPCSNALLEALACGLPAVYLESGSHGELVGEAGVGFADHGELLRAIDQVASDLGRYRGRIALRTLPEVTDAYLTAMGLSPTKPGRRSS